MSPILVFAAVFAALGFVLGVAFVDGATALHLGTLCASAR